jgi:hypothetical protein
MKELIIKLSDKEFDRVMRVSNKRRKSPSSLCKHILLQLADNDDIEAVTGQRKTDNSVYKKQKYNNKAGRNNQ